MSPQRIKDRPVGATDVPTAAVPRLLLAFRALVVAEPEVLQPVGVTDDGFWAQILGCDVGLVR